MEGCLANRRALVLLFTAVLGADLHMPWARVSAMFKPGQLYLALRDILNLT